MNQKPTLIGVDVDSTMADSLTDWFDWANTIATAGNMLIKPVDTTNILKGGANLTWGSHANIMEELLGIEDPGRYWKLEDLYNSVQPFPGVIEWFTNFRKHIDVLKGEGSNIKLVVVTTCFPEHETSKRDWINRFFPGIFDGFISTGDKSMVGLDILFDDKPEHCENAIANGVSFVICPEVGIEKPYQHERILQPKVEYGEIWNFLLRSDPNGEQILETIDKT